MTNVEIMRRQAKKLLAEGKLTGKSVDFVSTIMKYNKKKLKCLSSKQYQWLKDIVESKNIS